MNVCLIGMTPDHQIREKSRLLAPYLLKRYAENYVIAKGNLDIKVLDFSFDVNPKEMAFDILREKPDVVALSYYVWNFRSLMECASHLKEMLDRLLVIAGGPSVSFNAEEIMQNYSYIDVVSYDNRRGEIVFKDLMQCLVNKNVLGEVNGILYRSNDGRLIKTDPPTEEVDRSITMSPYINNDIVFNDKGGYYAIVETYRGCPFDCGYCCWGGQGSRLELVPMDRILEEVRIIYNNPNVKYVLFTDANFLLSRKRAEGIIRYLEKQSNFENITTKMCLNIESMDGEMARMLYGLPGFEFCFGLQTTNPVSLDLISKRRISPAVFEEKLNLIKKELPKIKYNIDIMLGLPGDTLDGFRKTLDFCFSMEPSNISIAYPIYLLPGSRFYNDRDKLKLHYTLDQPQRILETDDFPAQDIDKATNLAIWVQILINYYPAIAEFFYFSCKEKGTGERIALMESWINLIDSKVDLFRDINIREAATISFDEWNKAKTSRLKLATSTQAAYDIYLALYGLYKGYNSDIFTETIDLGFQIFSYYQDRDITLYGQTASDSLSEDFYEKYGEDKIRKVHSKFKV